jgi:hypothetical protein
MVSHVVRCQSLSGDKNIALHKDEHLAINRLLNELNIARGDYWGNIIYNCCRP